MEPMAKFRRILMWLTLIGTVNLAQLAVLSAFLPQSVQREADAGQNVGAKVTLMVTWELFNSFPLMLAWIALTVMLVLGFVAFGRLVRRPGLMAMHLGCVLILAGGMWGSKAGMKLMDSFSDHKRVYKGAMMLYEGESSKSVVDGNGKHFDDLPLEVRCERIRMEYYPYERKLGVVVVKTSKTGRWQAGEERQDRKWDSKIFRWREGRWEDLPKCDDIEIRVTDFTIMPAIAKPLILILPSSPHAPGRTVPATVGHVFDIMPGHRMNLKARVRRVYRARLASDRRDPGNLQDVAYDGPGSNPVAEVVLETLAANMFALTKKVAEAVDCPPGSLAERIRYMPAAEARKEQGHKHSGPIIVVAGPESDQHVPAEVGQEFTITTEKGDMLNGRVVRLLSVRLVKDPAKPGRLVPAEAEGPGTEPAAEIVLSKIHRVVHARTSNAWEVVARQTGRREPLMYIPTDDPKKAEGMQRPRITFEVRRGSRTEKGTITIRKAQPPQIEFNVARTGRTRAEAFVIHRALEAEQVPLAALYDSDEDWRNAGEPRIYANDDPPIKEYQSHLVIRQDGRKVASKVIEVNDPLYYGGYRFYQMGMDGDQAWTSITVKSDAGWLTVLAGMILLMLGTFIQFWFEPIWKAVTERRKERQAVTEAAGRKAGT